MKEAKELQKHNALDVQHVNTLEADNECLQKELSGSLECYTKELAQARDKLKLSQTALTGSKAEVYNLKRKCARARAAKQSAVQKATSQVLQQRNTFYLLKKGVYSDETRNLVRILVQAGVSAKNIKTVIQAVFAAAGITAVGKISPRTVARIIREGFYAACAQLGFEIDQTGGQISSYYSANTF